MEGVGLARDVAGVRRACRRSGGWAATQIPDHRPGRDRGTWPGGTRATGVRPQAEVPARVMRQLLGVESVDLGMVARHLLPALSPEVGQLDRGVAVLADAKVQLERLLETGDQLEQDGETTHRGPLAAPWKHDLRG